MRVFSPLVQACRKAVETKDYDGVHALLEAGADPNEFQVTRVIEHGGETRHVTSPMHIAFEAQDIRLVRTLCTAGGDPFLKSPDSSESGTFKDTPISGLAASTFVAGVRYLVNQYGRDSLDLPKDPLAAWPLQAIQAGKSIQMVEYLVDELKLDLFYKQNDGMDAMYMANQVGRDPVFLEFCYERGWPPNRPIFVQQTKNKVSVPKALREIFGSDEAYEETQDIAAQYRNNYPLHMSVFFGEADKVALHLRYGANPALCGTNGRNAFEVLQHRKDVTDLFGPCEGSYYDIQTFLDRSIKPNITPIKN